MAPSPGSPKAPGSPQATDTGFAERIRTLIDHYGGVTRIARTCGFSEGVVRSWRDGRSDPSRQRCLSLAQGLGISLVWLMSGDGSMLESPRALASPQGGQHVTTVDTRQLSHAMRIMQSTLESTGNKLPLESRAELLGEYYAVLGNPDPVTRAEGVSEIHRHLVRRLRRQSQQSDAA